MIATARGVPRRRLVLARSGCSRGRSAALRRAAAGATAPRAARQRDIRGARRARPRLRRHPRRAVRPGRRGAAPRVRPGAAGSLRRAERHRPLVAHPARSREPRARRRILRRGRTRDPLDRGLDRRDRRTTPSPGSTSAAPTPPACSGACCATRSSPRRATASSIKQALERAIALDPDLDDAYFGIGMYKYYADVAPAAAKVPALPADAAGRRPQGRARADAPRAQPRTPAAGRGRLPAAHPLSLVRAADAAGAASCSTRCTIGIPPIRSSSRRSPTSRIATSTTSPPASRPGGALLAAAREQRVNAAGAERSAGPARDRPAARGAAPDRRRDRDAAGGDCAAADALRTRSLPLAYLRARRGARPARRPAPRRSRPIAPRIAAAPAPDPHDVRTRGRPAPAARARSRTRGGVSAVARGLAAARAERPSGGRRPRSSARWR